jgi:hypothetical protein
MGKHLGCGRAFAALLPSSCFWVRRSRTSLPTAPAATFTAEEIGKTGYVSDRQPIHLCPSPIVRLQGCRRVTSGKITITSLGHEATLANTGGGLFVLNPEGAADKRAQGRLQSRVSTTSGSSVGLLKPKLSERVGKKSNCQGRHLPDHDAPPITKGDAAASA